LQTRFRRLQPAPSEGLQAKRDDISNRWILQERSEISVLREFESVARDAAQMVGCPVGADPINYWLHMLWLQMAPHHTDDNMPIIPRVCEISANYCLLVSQKCSALPESPLEKHFGEILIKTNLNNEELCTCYSWLLHPSLIQIKQAVFDEAKAQARKLKPPNPTDNDFCAICLVILSRDKLTKPPYTLWIDDLEKTLKGLKRIEKRDNKLVMKILKDPTKAISALMSLGTNNSFLAQYIHDVECLIEELNKGKASKKPDPRNEALLLLVDRLKNRGPVPRGTWDKIETAIISMGRMIYAESLRTIYEKLKKASTNPPAAPEKPAPSA
jgi:hypothetical protein